MVLNFFELKNSTDTSFDMINSEHADDNYTVGPYTEAGHDMWLAQGNGTKGVSIHAYSPGSAIRKLLYMWDEDWSISYRIGGGDVNKISVDGNKDFHIEVDQTNLIFICKNGSFHGNVDRVVVRNWQDSI